MAFIVEDAEGRKEFDIHVRDNDPNGNGKYQWAMVLQRLNGRDVINRHWRFAGPEFDTHTQACHYLGYHGAQFDHHIPNVAEHHEELAAAYAALPWDNPEIVIR